MKKSRKSKKWMRNRHRIISDVARGVLYPYTKWAYGIDIERFKNDGERAYLILLNRQTPFDQFFVGTSFPGAIYFLATEDIFSNGWISSLIRWMVAPIPIKKQTMDVGAVMNCFKVAKEGGTLAIAPEGNRTYSGKTGYMNPAIAGLAKKLKLPIALYRIEGGYGVQPRWSDVVRKGKMRAYVSRVIEPEEYEALSNEELFAIIKEGLYVNEGVSDGIYESKRSAEYLERVLYVCPYCGLSEFESHGTIVECKKCRKKLEYGPDKRFKSLEGSFPFQFMTQWYDYQNSFIARLDLTSYIETPLYSDRSNVFEVILKQRKKLLYRDANIFLYGDRVEIFEKGEQKKVFLFSEVTAVSVRGRNKLNIYVEDQVYQLKAGKRFNALKYVNIYYHYKNLHTGNEESDFLGI